jgi:hypothetical protein
MLALSMVWPVPQRYLARPTSNLNRPDLSRSGTLWDFLPRAIDSGMKRESDNFELKVRLPREWQAPIEDWAACERRKPTQLLRNIVEDALKARAHEHGAAA